MEIHTHNGKMNTGRKKLRIIPIILTVLMITVGSTGIPFHYGNNPDTETGYYHVNGIKSDRPPSEPYTAMYYGNIPEYMIKSNAANLKDITQKILDGLNQGKLPGYFIPSLRDTFYAVTIMKLIEGSVYRSDAIIDYIMLHFDPTGGFFDDDYCGEKIIYSDGWVRKGYTEVWATAYAVNSLAILGGLDNLTAEERSGIIDFLLDTLNIDGGFASVPPDAIGSPFENSSVTLSYYVYRALLNLGYTPDIYLKNNLTAFITSMQNVDPLYIYSYGGFYDKKSDDSVSIEASYYAVKLLQLINTGFPINLDALTVFIERMYDSDSRGIFNNYKYGKAVLNYPGYPSTALGLAIINITGITPQVDTFGAYLYVDGGFDTAAGGWRNAPGFAMYFLSDTYKVITALYGINKPPSDGKKILIIGGLKKYEKVIPYYWEKLAPTGILPSNSDSEVPPDKTVIGYSPLSSDFRGIADLDRATVLLELTGRLGELTPEAVDNIYSYIVGCLRNNGNGGLYFAEFPEYNRTELLLEGYGFPLELAELPYNVSTRSEFGRGLIQTREVLEILLRLGLLDRLISEYGAQPFIEEVNASRLQNGAFLPVSIIYPKIEGNPGAAVTYYSVETIYAAYRIADILREKTGISTAGLFVNTSTFIVENYLRTDGALKYFDDRTGGTYGSDDYHRILLTYRIMEIDGVSDNTILTPDIKEGISLWATYLDILPFNTNNGVPPIPAYYAAKLTYNSSAIPDPVPFIKFIYDVIGPYANITDISLPRGLITCCILFSDPYISTAVVLTPPTGYLGFPLGVNLRIPGVFDINIPGRAPIVGVDIGGTTAYLTAKYDETADVYTVTTPYDLDRNAYPEFGVTVSDAFSVRTPDGLTLGVLRVISYTAVLKASTCIEISTDGNITVAPERGGSLIINLTTYYTGASSTIIRPLREFTAVFAAKYTNGSTAFLPFTVTTEIRDNKYRAMYIFYNLTEEIKNITLYIYGDEIINPIISVSGNGDIINTTQNGGYAVITPSYTRISATGNGDGTGGDSGDGSGLTDGTGGENIPEMFIFGTVGMVGAVFFGSYLTGKKKTIPKKKDSLPGKAEGGKEKKRPGTVGSSDDKDDSVDSAEKIESSDREDSTVYGPAFTDWEETEMFSDDIPFNSDIHPKFGDLFDRSPIFPTDPIEEDEEFIPRTNNTPGGGSGFSDGKDLYGQYDDEDFFDGDIPEELLTESENGNDGGEDFGKYGPELYFPSEESELHGHLPETDGITDGIHSFRLRITPFGIEFDKEGNGDDINDR